jgi:hypothetical protein
MELDKIRYKTSAVYPRIKDVEIKVVFNINQQKMVYTTITLFPDMTLLKLRYFCGIYKRKRYLLLLKENALDRLHLDVSSVYKRIQNVNKRRLTFATDYFFIDIYILSRKTHCYFKVSLDYFGIEAVDDGLFGDAIHLQLVIKDLQWLTIYMYPNICQTNNLDRRYFEDHPLDIKEAHIHITK